MKSLSLKGLMLVALLSGACGGVAEDDLPVAAERHALATTDGQGRTWLVNGSGIDVISPGGVLRFTVGNRTIAGFRDGYRAQARFSCISSMALSPDGSIMNLAEPCRCAVRQVSMNGTTATIGNAACGL